MKELGFSGDVGCINKILTQLGYTVFDALTAQQALRFADKHQDKNQLPITDVSCRR